MHWAAIEPRSNPIGLLLELPRSENGIALTIEVVAKHVGLHILACGSWNGKHIHTVELYRRWSWRQGVRYLIMQ